jgi:transposase
MGEVSTIGLDIAKAVFQVHGIDGVGAVVIRKRVSRAKMLEFDKSILAWHRSCDASRRLAEIPGIGPIVATAGGRDW